MMALIMARLMVEAASVITAAITCPLFYWRDGATKAIAALIVCYLVGRAFAVSPDEREKFEKFCAQKPK